MYIKPKISLHLGVHKTATTYIQSRLDNSLGELNEHGINYVKLRVLRERLTSRLGDACFRRQDVFDALYPFLNCKRLIVSDENIIGGVDALSRQALYPFAKQRVKKILCGIEGLDIEAYLTIRSFPEYLISRYSEYLRHFRFRNFEDYMSGIRGKDISWLPLLEDLVDAGCKRIHINDFGYVVNGDGYMHDIIGKKVRIGEADQGNEVKRSKISQEKYEVAKFYAEKYSDKSTRRLIGMMDNFPQATRLTPFMPFSSQQQSVLKERYMEEIALIKSDPRFFYLSE